LLVMMGLRLPGCSVPKARPSALLDLASFGSRPIAARLLGSSPSPPCGSCSRRYCSETHGNRRKIGYASDVSKPAFFLTKQRDQEQNFPLIFVLSFIAVHFRGGIPSHRQQHGKKRIRSTVNK